MLTLNIHGWDLRRYNYFKIPNEKGFFQIHTMTRSHTGIRLRKKGDKIRKVLISSLVPLFIDEYMCLKYIKHCTKTTAVIGGKERELLVIIYTEDDYKIQFIIEKREDRFFYLFYGGETEIHFIHELQNLFYALYRKELPIKPEFGEDII